MNPPVNPPVNPPAFPFTEGPGLEPPAEYAEIVGSGRLCPVTLAGDNAAVLAVRHADVRTVLGDPRFSRQAYASGALFARKPESLALMQTDAPVHTRRRRSVAADFTFRRAVEARPGLEAFADKLVADLRDGRDEAELVEEFAVPFTLSVITDMIGVPASDLHLFRPWTNMMMSRGSATPAEVAAAHDAMHAYFTGLVDRIWADPGSSEGIIARLAPRPGEEPGMSRTETIVMSAGLLVAGYESTSNQLASCVYLLLSDRSRWEYLQRHPERVEDAVEEMLRWTSFTTSGGNPHVATEDVALTDRVVARGEVVVPLTDAANRDPDVYDRADELDLTRGAGQHVAFGFGRHRCLGAELARVELQVGIATLLREVPDMELAVAESELHWRRQMQVSGIWELPVRWGTDRSGARR